MAESIKQRVGPVFRETDSRKLFEAVLADLNAIKTILGGILRASATHNEGSLADGVGNATAFTVTGAALGDFAMASFEVDLVGVTVTAYVNAANSVVVRVQNESGGAVDLASTTLRIMVFQQAAFSALGSLNLTN